MKKKIKIKFLNGLQFVFFKKTVFDLFNLDEEFEFVDSENPDFILFGPYGNDIPQKGDYVRIGYFCENIIPDMSICEWAFGIPREEEVQHPRYKRIQWHGLDPTCLVKQITDNEIDQIVTGKTKFCNFLYSHRVPYREEFFRQLSRYKKVDAPGKSMNNMPSIDHLYQGNIWERKRQFLNGYKFTIAFENYSYPGYQTEKLYDAMQCYSLPVYCGDPYIHEIFNTNSFLNTRDYVTINYGRGIQLLEKLGQPDFKDIRPAFYTGIRDRIKRKLKATTRQVKMHLQYRKLDFSDLIDRIIELDRNPDLYFSYLKQPWFNNNQVPEKYNQKQAWTDIFNSK